jgi:hypothetical protein
MARLIAVLSALVLAGCASMGQPLHVACLACSTLASMGMCGGGKSIATPECAAGEEIWIANFDAFLERGARPVFQCEPRRLGGELP